MADLTAKLEEQGATFRSQIKSKESEVSLLHREINSLRADYEKLVEIKQALTMEISIYKQIIEGEEKRIKKEQQNTTLLRSIYLNVAARTSSFPFFNFSKVLTNERKY